MQKDTEVDTMRDGEMELQFVLRDLVATIFQTRLGSDFCEMGRSLSKLWKVEDELPKMRALM